MTARARDIPARRLLSFSASRFFAQRPLHLRAFPLDWLSLHPLRHLDASPRSRVSAFPLKHLAGSAQCSDVGSFAETGKPLGRPRFRRLKGWLPSRTSWAASGRPRQMRFWRICCTGRATMRAWRVCKRSWRRPLRRLRVRVGRQPITLLGMRPRPTLDREVLEVLWPDTPSCARRQLVPRLRPEAERR